MGGIICFPFDFRLNSVETSLFFYKNWLKPTAAGPSASDACLTLDTSCSFFNNLKAQPSGGNQILSAPGIVTFNFVPKLLL